jgi:uncharacterized damage-inducible protein DinB
MHRAKGRNGLDFRDILRLGLDEYLSDLKEALEGLTPDERRFQPASKSHHIDFAVWHMARVEDHWIQVFAQHAGSVWQCEGWSDRFGIPEPDHGAGYTAEQVRDLPSFDMDPMMANFDAVRVETHGYLDRMTEATLAEALQPGPRHDYTIANMFSHLIVEEAQHVGQVAYLRGIQRGLGK